MYTQIIQDYNGQIAKVSHSNSPYANLERVTAFLDSLGTGGNYEFVLADSDMPNTTDVRSIMQGDSFIGTVSVYRVTEEIYKMSEEMPSDNDLKKLGVTYSDVARSYTLYAYSSERGILGYAYLSHVSKDVMQLNELLLIENDYQTVAEVLRGVLLKCPWVMELYGNIDTQYVNTFAAIGADVEVMTATDTLFRFRLNRNILI